MRCGAIATLVLAASLGAAPAVFAAFHTGDVIVGGIVTTEVGDSIEFTGKLRQFAPDGTLIQEFYSGDAFTVDLAFSPDGVLFGAGGNNILRFANNGNMLPPLVAFPYSVKSVDFDRSGNLFGTSGSGYVLRFGSDGSQQGVTTLASNSSTSWADLGNDRCTLYYLKNPSPQFGRYDLCGNSALPPLPTELGDAGQTLIALTDGTLLVSTFHRDMYRIGQNGAILRHYATKGIAYARDLSSNFVWIDSGTGFAKFDLQGDAIVAGPFPPGAGGIFGIVVVGADAATIPALSPLLLALLALGVAVFALLRLRT